MCKWNRCKSGCSTVSPVFILYRHFFPPFYTAIFLFLFILVQFSVQFFVLFSFFLHLLFISWIFEFLNSWIFSWIPLWIFLTCVKEEKQTEKWKTENSCILYSTLYSSLHDTLCLCNACFEWGWSPDLVRKRADSRQKQKAENRIV